MISSDDIVGHKRIGSEPIRLTPGSVSKAALVQRTHADSRDTRSGSLRSSDDLYLPNPRFIDQ